MEMLHLHVSAKTRTRDNALKLTLRVVGMAFVIWRRRTFPAGTPVVWAKDEMIRYALSRFGGRCGIQWRQALPMAGPGAPSAGAGKTTGPE
ncbi:hypothetical protein K9F62_03195 [Desulfovibrio sp. JY]|nr:hypothetical protein K9F62_03195 [Desulfovibrio sp. JY]